MRRSTVVILILSLCLIVGGALLSGCAWAVASGNIGIVLYWEGGQLRRITPDMAESRLQSRQVTFDRLEEITLDCDSSAMILQPGEGYSLSYSWNPREGEPSYQLEEGRLTYRQQRTPASRRYLFQFDPHRWLQNEQPTVTLTYPGGSSLAAVTLNNDFGKISVQGLAAEGPVAITCDSGNVALSQLTVADALTVSVDFGNLTLSQVEAGSALFDIDSGKGRLENLTVGELVYHGSFGASSYENVTAERFTVESDSGSVTVKNSQLGEAEFSLDFGSLSATNTQAHNLQVENRNGKTRLHGRFTGNIALVNDFGALEFETSLPKEQYSYDVKTEFGTLRVNGQKNPDPAYDPGDAQHHLQVESANGAVSLTFWPSPAPPASSGGQ